MGILGVSITEPKLQCLTSVMPKLPFARALYVSRVFCNYCPQRGVLSEHSEQLYPCQIYHAQSLGEVFREKKLQECGKNKCRPSETFFCSVMPYYTTGGIYKRLSTPPALVRRIHLGRSRKQLEYVDMGWGYHGSYRGTETVQYSKSYGPSKMLCDM